MSQLVKDIGGICISVSVLLLTLSFCYSVFLMKKDFDKK